MTEREISRNAARRLAIIRHAQEVSGNVALTCRYYGMARPSYYKWLRRDGWSRALHRRGLRYRPRPSAKAIIELSGIQCAVPLMPSTEE